MEREKSNRRVRRKFSEEYKIEAVRMVVEGSRTKREVAKSLGISAALLSRWYAASREGKHGSHVAVSLNESERIRQLEREVQELKLERELLKKAAAYFAKNQT
jgi:transposase